MSKYIDVDNRCLPVIHIYVDTVGKHYGDNLGSNNANGNMSKVIHEKYNNQFKRNQISKSKGNP